jgi:outer membrane protein
MRKALSGFLAPLLLLAAVPVLAQTAAPAPKMTLKECVELVLQNNPAVAIASESVTGAEDKVAEARSQAFPQVNVLGNYLYNSLKQEFSFDFFGQTFNMKFSQPNSYDFRAGLTQQLFTFGRIKNSIALSRTGVELARTGLGLTRQALSYQVAPVFYGILFFQEAIKVLDENIGLFEKRLAIMTERYQAGLVSSFDTSSLQVQISALRGQRLDFENNIRKLALAFNTLAGRPADAPFEPEGTLAYSVAPADKARLLAEAQARRLEFEQLDQQVQVTRLGMKVARAASLPALIAGFNYDFRNGTFPDMEVIRGMWTASLTLNYPLFDGFRTKAVVAEGESALRTLDLQRRNLLQNIGLEIDTNLSDLRTIEQKVDIEKLKIKQAEEALRIADDRYRRGLLSATDYIESQNNLAAAQLGYLQLVYNHILGGFSLDRAVGKSLID